MIQCSMYYVYYRTNARHYIQIVEYTNRKQFLENNLVIDIEIPNHCGGYPITKEKKLLHLKV